MKLNAGPFPLQNDEDEVPSESPSDEDDTWDLCSISEEDEEDWEPNLKSSRDESDTEDVMLLVDAGDWPSHPNGNPSAALLPSGTRDDGESTYPSGRKMSESDWDVFMATGGIERDGTGLTDVGWEEASDKREVERGKKG